MRKILCCILALSLLLPVFLPVLTNAQTYEKAEDALNDANKFLKDKLDLADYYVWEINGKNLNKEYAQKGTAAFLNRPIFVYGDQAAASMEATSKGGESVKGGIYRAMGYTVENSAFPNPDFPHDNEGYLDEHKKWVKLPWEDGINKESYDGVDGGKSSRDLTDGAVNLIKKWTNKDTIFNPDEVEKYTGQRNFFAARAEDIPPAIKDNFEDFLYIVQPPTEHSWGLGVAFYYWDGFNRFNYKSFLLKPYDMMSKDLSAKFTTLSPGSIKGEEVTVGISVISSFKEDVIGVPFKWEITNAANDTPIRATFTGHATVSRGILDKIPAQGERVFYASFEMPDSDVQIKFEINRDGKYPKEDTISNNFLEAVIKKEVPSGIFDLDYNILSRQVKYPLSKTGIEAVLQLPRGYWDGNARGALNVENQATDLFRDFTVKNNPVVDEPSERIVRKPEINTILYRTDFGDDPQNGYWLNWTPPGEPKKRSGSVGYSGSVDRRYEYIWYCSAENCAGHTGHGTASANFDSGRDTKIIRTFIYNGMSTIMPKIFENKIDNNTSKSREKKLYWTSEPYQFNVIRWMFHLDQDDNLYNSTPVQGQYQRTFTQQCSAINTWTTPSPMAKDYERSREAARDRDYRKSEYDKAVFATDLDFRDVDYPIKSGYYFNPTGTYTFTVKTVTYKTTRDDTKDHQDLVNAVINAFRYESDLMYINDDKEPVNLQNEVLPPDGNSYGRKPAALTAQDPTGVNELVLLNVLDRSDDESRYRKKVEEIQHSEEVDGDTHQYWKEILEGYHESGTIDSKLNFKYREYIKDGQHLYRITEETTVTIEINPENSKIYTHVHMPDGKYTVKAWIEDINLAKINHEYKRLGVFKGIASLDEIHVSVKGSMYEDVN